MLWTKQGQEKGKGRRRSRSRKRSTLDLQAWEVVIGCSRLFAWPKAPTDWKQTKRKLEPRLKRSWNREKTW